MSEQPDYAYGDGQPMGESLLSGSQFGICTPDDPDGALPEHQPGYVAPTPYDGPTIGPAPEGSGDGEGGHLHHPDELPEEDPQDTEYPYQGEDTVPEVVGD